MDIFPRAMNDVMLYQGDCLEVMKTLDHVDLVLADPPYGMNLDTNFKRFSGSNSKWSNNSHAPVINDDKSFDPSPFLGYPRVILWGMNHYCNTLPPGGALVWVKKRDSQLGTFLSDAEIAWVKGIKGVYVFRHMWHGVCRDSEIGQPVLHPNQKPIALMKWCVEKFTKPGDTVADPFMGSGTTGVACVQTGRNFIGIELDPAYFAIAQRRIEQAQMQLPLLELA